MNNQPSVRLQLAQKLAEQFSKFPNVEAIAVAGSLASGTVDSDSDIDLYVYTTRMQTSQGQVSVIPLEAREAIVAQLGATQADLNLQFWDLGDEWYDASTGIEVDVIYWDTTWIAEQLDRVLVQHQASVGYTTCFWHTIYNSHVLYDRHGWFQSLQEKSRVPFPEPLRRAIIAKNHPVLRNVIPSYLHQIEKALKRGDAVSVNHRVAALFASYFDVLFALNRVRNPGEKRLVEVALTHCAQVPQDMKAQIEAVLQAAAPFPHSVLSASDLVARIETLLDGLDALLMAEDLIQAIPCSLVRSSPCSPCALTSLIAEEWEFRMQENPLFATTCGDHRFNDRLPDVSEAAVARRLAQLRAYLEKLVAIPYEAISSEDQLNYTLFEQDLKNQIADIEFGLHLMPMTKVYGFHVDFPDVLNVTPFNTLVDYENYVARLDAFQSYVAGQISLMRLGLRNGYIQPQVALEGIEDALQAHIVSDPVQSLFFEPFTHIPAGMGEADRARLMAAGREAIANSLVPGYQALLDFVRDTYLPAAPKQIGAANLPNGRAFYGYCVHKFTTLDLTPEEVHEIGLAEVRRIRGEMETLIRNVGFAGGMHEFLHFLRTDARFYVETSEALMQHVALIMKKIDGELPVLFNQLPRTPYGLRRIPDYIAPKTTTAYYFPAAGDGTKAGFYYVNTYGLASRPLYEYEALSLHEAVPGHHLQLALQMELEMPNFRRFGGVTAFVEGWALYAERLGLEVGFYEDPYCDFGRLTFEIWRASRLVVDTGMHYLGWSRQQAIDFMLENTALSELNIHNEIDRYIAWPGQALAYKIGELKIRELRTFAEETLGIHFDVREFHRIVLENGGIPLSVLEAHVKAWVAMLKV
ncbi:MAG: DUF885 family protein [Anaerolineae bacterium]|nr:DUF885 family protein [Anaerolineae bacterium]